MSNLGLPLQGLNLLLIEDEQDIRELLSYVLQSEGAQVKTVIYVYEALEALEELRPDVVLSNIYLPDGDGCSLISLWRDKEAELGIEPVPAIIITESEREVHKKRLHQAGFQTYLTRPFDLERVVQTVANLARQRIAGKRRP